MDAREAGQMGLATVLYYLTTTILATMVSRYYSEEKRDRYVSVGNSPCDHNSSG